MNNDPENAKNIRILIYTIMELFKGVGYYDVAIMPRFLAQELLEWKINTDKEKAKILRDSNATSFNLFDK